MFSRTGQTDSRDRLPSGKPQWRVRRVGCSLLILAVLLAFSATTRREYCCLCGKYRDVTTINPLLLFEHGLRLRARQYHSQISRVLQDLNASQGVGHRWIAYERDAFFHRFGEGWLYVTPHSALYHNQRIVVGNATWGTSFERMVDADPELAQAVARTLLKPCSNEEWESRVAPVNDYFLFFPPQATASLLDEYRAMVGLPARRGRRELTPDNSPE